MKKVQMKKGLVWSLVMMFLLILSNTANAALTTIGTAQFNGGGTAYNLIWDDDNNGNSVVWLDYFKTSPIWSAQNTWTAGLDSALTLNLYAGYSVTWDSTWRLPSTVDELYEYGYDGSTTGGYNITSSEMGHLYYTELGNKGYLATDGSYPQPGWGLTNTGDFQNLNGSWYWSVTEYSDDPDRAWAFNMDQGTQSINFKSTGFYGLAVRSGEVEVVPVPGAIWLLGSGLVGLVGIRRRFYQ